MEADLFLPPGSFLLVHLTDFQCVSSALTVHCPSAADRARWLEKTQQAQVCDAGRQAGEGAGAQTQEGRTKERREKLGEKHSASDQTAPLVCPQRKTQP